MKETVKLSFAFSLLFFSNLTMAGNACYITGNIKSVVPSAGDVGVSINAEAAGCTCAYSGSTITLTWIDINTDGGKSMYSTALSAMALNKQVTATIIDGLGQGAPGNDSVVGRYWLDCQVKALQLNG